MSLKILQSQLETTTDITIFCSVLHILTSINELHSIVPDEILLKTIDILVKPPTLVHLSRILDSLGQLSNRSRVIDLLKQRETLLNLLSHLESETSIDIQLRILSLLQQCVNDHATAR
jgi:hypothetical protein